MKLYEKILIGTFLLLLGIRPFLSEDTAFALFCLFISLWAISYLIGGYWLFNPKENKRYFIPIIAGVAFAIALFTLPYTIGINRYGVFLNILPLFNIVFFIALSIYLILKRKKNKSKLSLKNIFIRSLVILVVTCFFSYTPVSFKPYRYVLIALNYGNEYLVSNMQMFNYTEKFEKEIKNGDCERAIEYAKKANEAGKRWLGVSSEEIDNSHQNELWKISGTFSNLYKAYKCKADGYYDKSEYEQALAYYIKADEMLYACEYNSKYWETEQAHSLNHTALCYKKLCNYEYADSLFIKAIKKYQTVKENIEDRNMAFFCSNLAVSQAEQLQFGYSNLLYKAAIAILQKDSSNNNEKEIIENYHSLIRNHLQADSLDNAMFLIEETFKRIDNEIIDFCITNLYYGICLYKSNQYKRADEIYTECLDCFKKYVEQTHQNIAEVHLALAQSKIALAEYEKAKDHLNKGIEITTKNFGKNSVKYANYLKIYAFLDKLLADYNKSEKKYNQVLEIYTREFGERDWRLPEILSGIADLNIIFSNYGKAKTYSDRSMSIANDLFFSDTPGMSGLINQTAYVNYCVGFYEVSDSLYRISIKMNKNIGLNLNVQTATALNGLGLVMTAKRKYQIADSLFAQSLYLHKKIFTENHPATAVVYLNFANLKLSQNKLKEAKEMLDKSLNTNRKFFNNGHDIFADIYVAYGDLAKKEKQPKIANDYYQKALAIYLEKFDEKHIKVVMTKKKLKNE